MSMFQAAALGVAGALLAIQFKGGKQECGIYLTVAVSLLLCFGMLGKLQTIVASVRELSRFLQLDVMYMGTLLKMIGITYTAEFASGICKDAGYHTIASQIELFAKLAILVLGMPVLMTLFETISRFLS